MNTQNQQVLAHLKQGKTLTPIEALREYGMFRLAARVYELKEDGWPVKTERVRTATNTFAKYSLDLDKSLWPET